ncbi:MAG: hypothetical protein ABI851_00640 [Saprospiraceae bacterium]
MKAKKRSLFYLCLVFLLFGTFSTSCKTGYGCPAEGSQVVVDENVKPRSKPSSGLYDKKGRMNSSSNKNDHRKPKKHTN